MQKSLQEQQDLCHFHRTSTQTTSSYPGRLYGTHITRQHLPDLLDLQLHVYRSSLKITSHSTVNNHQMHVHTLSLFTKSIDKRPGQYRECKYDINAVFVVHLLFTYFYFLFSFLLLLDCGQFNLNLRCFVWSAKNPCYFTSILAEVVK